MHPLPRIVATPVPARLPALLSAARRLAALPLSALLLCHPASAAPADQPWAAMAHTSFVHQVAPALGVGTSFAQDRSGFVWMGTQSGLIRWDGYKLRRYEANVARANSLADGYIHALLVDRGGNLWIGTSAGGLARYDAANDNFINIGAGVGTGGLSHARVSALADDGEGGIWIGTGGGLERIDAQGKVWPSSSGTPQIGAAQLPEGGIESLLRDRSGALWVGTRHGLWRRPHNRAPLMPVALAEPGQAEPAVGTLYQDTAGRVWIGTRTAGAFVIDGAGKAARAVRETGVTQALQSERVFSIVETRTGTMWMATEGAGIVELDVASGRTRRLRNIAGTADSLHDNDVLTLFRERSGQIFLGSNEAMSLHDPRPRAFVTVRSTGSKSGNKLSVPTMLVRPDGRVWMAVTGGGIDIVDPMSGSVGELQPGATHAAGGLPKGRVLAMTNGPDDSVYLGTQQGLFRSRGDGTHMERVVIPSRDGSASVWALSYADGVLWMGGLDGLWALDISNASKPALLRHEAAGLPDTRVTCILPLPDGSVWFGTRAGLARIERGSRALEILPGDVTDPTRIPPGFVSALLLDKRGRLWVSTFSSGIALLERTDAGGRRWFRRFGVDQGLPDNGVNKVLEDNQGMIWASTDNGLARIDPVSFKIRKLGAADGVHVPTYWTSSGAHGANGDLYFGGLSGLTIVRPKELKEISYVAPVVLTQLTLGSRQVPVGPFNRSAGMPAPTPAPLVITPAGRERGFALEFAALDYSAPELSRYQYRLAGFDSGWIDSDTSLRRASYNNLPPGDYTLQLRGTSRSAPAPVQLDVPVRVLPAWHQKSWVHVLGTLAGLLLVIALIQARTTLLRRRQHELEDMVNVRTAELRTIQSKLETLAYADPLTGLPNRRLFNDEMRHLAAQAQRGGGTFGLLLIDLDHFKAVNDTLGHDAGDALLVEAAQRLKLAVREADRVVRLGGDEFAVLLTGLVDEHTIGSICNRIVGSLAEPVVFGDVTMRISASVGAARFEVSQSGVDGLYKAADLALYRAKEAGRNTWRLGGQREAA